MKIALLFVLLNVSACISAKVPCVCLRNYKDCDLDFVQNQYSFCKERNNISCSQKDWDNLCRQDLQLCQSNF